MQLSAKSEKLSQKESSVCSKHIICLNCNN